MRLNTLHNLAFFLGLMRRAREAIEQDQYAELVQAYR
jgi:tRNA-guanine family transglycosylase